MTLASFHGHRNLETLIINTALLSEKIGYMQHMDFFFSVFATYGLKKRQNVCLDPVQESKQSKCQSALYVKVLAPSYIFNDNWFLHKHRRMDKPIKMAQISDGYPSILMTS